ncbi:MAG: hypothetical protein Q8R18_00950 [bacterium]|nr:hypothetical protein [bacterium]
MERIVMYKDIDLVEVGPLSRLLTDNGYRYDYRFDPAPAGMKNSIYSPAGTVVGHAAFKYSLVDDGNISGIERIYVSDSTLDELLRTTFKI